MEQKGVVEKVESKMEQYWIAWLKCDWDTLSRLEKEFANPPITYADVAENS